MDDSFEDATDSVVETLSSSDLMALNADDEVTNIQWRSERNRCGDAPTEAPGMNVEAAAAALFELEEEGRGRRPPTRTRAHDQANDPAKGRARVSVAARGRRALPL